MHKAGLFKNAISKVKECHLPGKRIRRESMDEEIDFENEVLGESRKEQLQPKMRSAIIQNEKRITPYQSNPQEPIYKKLQVIKNPIRIETKQFGDKKLIIKRGVSTTASKKIIPQSNVQSVLNKSDNLTWKHDLFTDVQQGYFKLFVRNLPLSVSQEELNEIFSEYGPVSGLNVKPS